MYFNRTTNLTFFNIPLPPTASGFPKILDLSLKDDELFVVALSWFTESVAGD